MDIDQISDRLYAIGAAILDKTGGKPWHGPELRIKDNACHIDLYCSDIKAKALDYAKGPTPEAALDKADRILAAMPDNNTAALYRHMARVADCIDKAADDGIADEYVTPLRLTVKAMSDNLLAAPVLP